MFRSLFWAIIRSQLNMRKLYSVIYKINFIYIYLKFNEISLNFIINYLHISKIYLKFKEIFLNLNIYILFYKLHFTISSNSVET